MLLMIFMYLGWFGSSEWSIVCRGWFRRHRIPENDRSLRHGAESVAIMRRNELPSIGRRCWRDACTPDRESHLVAKRARATAASRTSSVRRRRRRWQSAYKH